MGGCGGKSASGFRWLCLVRSAVALVITVLAAVVFAMGLQHLLLRPPRLQLNISQSDVFVARYKSFGVTRYGCRFYLEATNPSELAYVHYSNLTVQLFDTSPPPASGNRPFARFGYMSPSSISLAPKEEQEFIVYGLTEDTNDVVDEQKLFKEDNAVMMLTGVVVLDNNQGAIQLYRANFRCQPVTVKSNAPLPEPSSNNFKADCLWVWQPDL